MDRNAIRELIGNINIYNQSDGNINPFIQAPNNVMDNDPYIMTENDFLISFNSKSFPSDTSREIALSGLRSSAGRTTTVPSDDNIRNAINLYRYVNVLYEQMKNLCRTGSTINRMSRSDCSRAQGALGNVMVELSAFIKKKLFMVEKKIVKQNTKVISKID